MTQIEKMELFIRAMKREVEIELLFDSKEIHTGFDSEKLLGRIDVWKKVRWEEKESKWYIGNGRYASISLWEILYKNMELRIAKVRANDAIV